MFTTYYVPVAVHLSSPVRNIDSNKNERYCTSVKMGYENQLLQMQGHHFVGEVYCSGKRRTRDCGSVLLLWIAWYRLQRDMSVSTDNLSIAYPLVDSKMAYFQTEHINKTDGQIIWSPHTVSRGTQGTKVFDMRCLWAIRCVTRADRLQNIKIREDTFTPESITVVNRHKRL